MNDAVQPLYESLENADKLLKRSAHELSIPLAHTQYVTPFEPSVREIPLSVWLFYPLDSDVSQLESDGSTRRLKETFLRHLESSSMPSWVLENVQFVVDSVENVKKNFRGSFFLRTR